MAFLLGHKAKHKDERNPGGKPLNLEPTDNPSFIGSAPPDPADDLLQLVNIGATSRAENTFVLQKRTEDISAQLGSLFSLHEQREIEINEGAEALSNFVSASIAKLNDHKAAADNEIKEKFANLDAEIKAWKDEEEVIAKTQQFGKLVKINGTVAQTLKWERHHRTTNTHTDFYHHQHPAVGGGVFMTSSQNLLQFPETTIAAMFSGTTVQGPTMKLVCHVFLTHP